jgi:hypothetical protein
LITYHSRIAVENAQGVHVRFIPRALAEAMIRGGSATPQKSVGKIRVIVLVRTAATSAHRVGDATPGHSFGVRFTRWITIGQSRVIEHHPRCLYG